MRGWVKEYLAALGAPRTAATWLAATAVAAATGPFGTFVGMTFPVRLAYWATVIAVALAIGLAIRPALRRYWPAPSYPAETLRTAAILTVLFTPCLLAITAAFAGPQSGEAAMHPLAKALVVFAVPLSALVAHYLGLIPERAGRTVAWTGAGGEPDALADPPGSPRLLRRIGGGAQRVLRVSGRDHYIDVVTDAGPERLLMRFSDALEELEGATGAQVHRSHWVSSEAVTEVERDGRRTFLVLTCGDRVPVSRSYRPDLVAAGFLHGSASGGTGTARGGSPSSTA